MKTVAKERPREFAEGSAFNQRSTPAAPIKRQSAFLIAAIIGLALGILVSRIVFTPLSGAFEEKARLEIDANIESGTFFEVFVNGEYDRSWRERVRPGQPFRYVLDDVPAKIHTLRLDFTDASETHAKITEITLAVAGARRSSVPLADVASWQVNQVEKLAADGAVEMRTTGNDPFLFASGLTLDVSDPTEDSWRAWALRHVGALTLAVVSALFLCCAAGWSVAVPVVALVAATTFLCRAVAAYVLSLPIGRPDVKHAIGHAGFFGYAKQPEQVALLASFGTICVVALVVKLLALVVPGRELAPLRTERRPFSVLRVGSIILLFAVTAFPQIHAAEESYVSAGQVLSGYDWGNIFTWDYLVQYGFLPHRDFWFPYSGELWQLGTGAISVWQTYLVQLVLFAVIFSSLYELCNRRVLLPLVLLFPTAYLIQSGVLLGTKRYLASVAAVLFASAIAKARPAHIAPYLLFGAFLGWVFYREPGQLVYGGPSLVLAGLFFLLSYYPEIPFAGRLGRLLVVAGTALAVVGLQIAGLQSTGQLPGFITLYEHMSSIASCGSVPAPLLQWYALSPKFENIVLVGTHLIAGLGVIYLLTNRFRVLGISLFGIALVLLVVYFKMLVRPHMAQQMLAPLTIAGAVLLGYLSNFVRPMQYFAAAFIFGAILGSSPHFESTRLIALERWKNVVTLPENAAALADGITPTTEILDAHYAPERFTGLDNDTTALIAFLRSQSFPRFGGKLFVLGDDSYLYSLVKEKPCPFITFYNMSDVWAQAATVECVAARKPEVVVWDSMFQKFDEVPNVTRVPILFSYVVTHFVPERSIGRYQILRPRRDGEALAWDFWIEKLGKSVDLGVLPANASMSDLAPCTSKRCLELAELKQTSTPRSPVTVKIGDRELSVVFQDSPGTLYVNLSRIWFWAAARSEGLEPTISAGEIVRREESPDILY